MSDNPPDTPPTKPPEKGWLEQLRDRIAEWMDGLVDPPMPIPVPVPVPGRGRR